VERPLSLSESQIVNELVCILKKGPSNVSPLIGAIRVDDDRVRKILTHYDGIYWKRTLERDRNSSIYSLVDKLENIDPKRLEDTIKEDKQLGQINLDFELTSFTLKRIISLLSLYQKLSEDKLDELLNDFALARIKLNRNITSMNKFVKIDVYSIHDQHTKNLLRITREFAGLLKNAHHAFPQKHKDSITKKMKTVKKFKNVSDVDLLWHLTMMKYSKMQTS